MVETAEDFLVRRIGLLYFDLPLLLKVIEPCLQTMAANLKWSDARVSEERGRLKILIDRAQGALKKLLCFILQQHELRS